MYKHIHKYPKNSISKYSPGTTYAYNVGDRISESAPKINFYILCLFA